MRTVWTIVAILVGLGVAGAFFYGLTTRSGPTQPTAQQATQPSAPSETPAADAPSPQAAEDPEVVAPQESPTETETAQTPAPAEPTGPAVTAGPPRPFDGLRVVAAPPPAQTTSIGSTDPTTGYKLAVTLSQWGASVSKIELSEFKERPHSQQPYMIMAAAKDAAGFFHYPMAALGVSINDQYVSLQDARWNIDPDTPGAFDVTIVDAQDQPVLRIHRRYMLTTGVTGYDLRLNQHFENLSGRPLEIVWHQNGQAEATADPTTYMGDRRHVVAGYFDLRYDPQRHNVYTRDTFLDRGHVLSELTEENRPFWPNHELHGQVELLWLATTNRYFALALHLPVPASATGPAPALAEPFAFSSDPKAGVLQVIGDRGTGRVDQRTLMFRLTSEPIALTADASHELNLSLYAGPRSNEVFRQPPYDLLGFSNLVVYSLGGWCAICTFQWLAHALLWFLHLIHGDVISIGGMGIGVHDWGIAIIILVVVVRGILHPITKRSQINMMRMGKQMAALQPELEKLKKKYKDDQQKLQAEQMRLYREKGVNPANMLGCLPMFLQMPIWVALYAMLFYAIELRHEPAFYGVFQAISGGAWPFLADLSDADRFIPLGAGFNIPLLGWHVSSINLLPILMAVVFFVQQQLMAPPPANDQQAQQQKIMKWTTLMFPIFLYSAPSGLTLYIMASTAAGIVDSWIVRRHIKREEEAGTLLQPRKAPKAGGFMDRLHKMMEERQRMMAEAQKRQQRGGK